MTKVDLYYSVCQYTPDIIRGESINVAIVIHCPTIGYEFSKVFVTTNYNRLRSFDDEYNGEYIKMVFNQIKYQFSYDCDVLYNVMDEYSDDFFDDIYDTTFIDNRSMYYVNEFEFLETKSVKQIDSQKIEQTVNDLYRTYLYYDLPKEKRITKDKVKSLLRKELRNLKVVPSENKITDMFGDEIFDFENNDFFVKAMTLDYKNHSSLKTQIKSLHSDIANNRNKLKNKKIKIVVVNQTDFEDNYRLANEVSKINDLKEFDIEIDDLPSVITDIGYRQKGYK